MGIFSAIKDAIFGQAADATAPPAAQPAAAAQPAPSAPAQPQPVQEVDLEKTLSSMPNADSLNWQSSIVDLMKVLGIDSSYEHRKQLAQELGRQDYSGSAEDNIWLHKRTLEELARNGARIPASMLA
jgi:hypothetical protein